MYLVDLNVKKKKKTYNKTLQTSILVTLSKSIQLGVSAKLYKYILLLVASLGRGQERERETEMIVTNAVMPRHFAYFE